MSDKTQSDRGLLKKAFTFYVDKIWAFLTPPSLSVDSLFTEAYLLAQTFETPLPPSTFFTYFSYSQFLTVFKYSVYIVGFVV